MSMLSRLLAPRPVKRWDRWRLGGATKIARGRRRWPEWVLLWSVPSFLLGIALAATWGDKPASAPAMAGAWLFLVAAVALVVSAPVAAWRWGKAERTARAAMTQVAALTEAAGQQPGTAIQPDDAVIQPGDAIQPDDAGTPEPCPLPGPEPGGHGHPERPHPPKPDCPPGARPEPV